MILKKQYGILIKYFRAIHLFLYGLMILLAIKSRTVLNFFVDYVKNNYTTTIMKNMSRVYISIFIYVLIFLILALLICIYVLLAHKKKPTKVYLITIIYYVLFLIMIFIAGHLMNSLNNGLWSTSSARIYRDISLMVYYSQFVILIIMGIRALGFDGNKFNFKKDLEELQLEEGDTDFVEVNLNIDTSKAKRTSRRFVREFGYYYKENKYMFIGIFILIVIFIFYFIFRDYDKLKFNYKQYEIFNYDGLQYKVEDCILTDLDTKGEVIDDRYNFIVVKFSVQNNSDRDKIIKYKDFKLYIGDDYYYPVISFGARFGDYGKPYQENVITKNKKYVFQVPYKVKKSVNLDDINIVIYNGLSYKKKNFAAKTINISLNPVYVGGMRFINEVNLEDPLSFSDSYIGDSSIVVHDFYLGDKYYYDYELCSDDECKNYKDFIIIDYSLESSKTLLVLDCDIVEDKDRMNSSIDLFDSFVTIDYRVEGKMSTSEVKNITPKNFNGHIVLLIDREVLNSDEIELIFTIRNKKYGVYLKKSTTN